MSSVQILGVRIDNVSMDEAVSRVQTFLGLSQSAVFTPNPEMLVAASNNQKFLGVLNESALNIPDGAGLLWAAKKLGSPLKERVTGTDLLEKICAENLGPVFFLGAAEGVAKKASENLKHKYPTLQVAGAHSGSPRVEDAEGIIQNINESGASILFVAFGAPAQELWIHEHLSKLETVKLAVGVGGAFDFFAGKRKRAPKIFRALGIEWLWRLIIEPSRFNRILTATVRFPRLVRQFGQSSPLHAEDRDH